ncbi:hypothetical protein KKJ17_18190 [Xenorhabdus bovienii]|uniref:hypothetical protein n=1 Tax=Xenorhabdus bovienii TaxID=40576 RepID=UPI0023B26E77|nr:hypothetical protein [Xenorhabdus bovienii]MDE9519598.1 hypothetical protein [Xenorhabdus bovienii]
MAMQMKYSLKKNADLIIGQSFLLTVNLQSNKSINKYSTISFSNVKNIIAPLEPISLVLSSNDKKATVTVGLTVCSNIIENELITFNIDTTVADFESGSFQCTAKKIDIGSFSLTVDNNFLDMSSKPDYNDPPTSNLYAKVHTTIHDPNGNVLSGVPIFITENIPDTLSNFHIYDAEQNTRIYTQSVNNSEGIFINSDKSGKVIFYLYPQYSLSSVLELFSVLPGTTNMVPADLPIFVADREPADFFHSLRMPDIMNYSGGKLISYDGSPDFYVQIASYPKATSGDYILFFVKKGGDTDKYSQVFFRVNDPNIDLNTYSIKLPYSIFEKGISSEFSYTVIFDGYTKVSQSLLLTYMGGAIYKPDPKVTRNYGRCIVYTSLGIHEHYIPYGTEINYDSIKRYLDNKYQPNTGLFVQVLGGDNLEGKVPLGSDVTLNIYVEAATGNFLKSLTQTMPEKVDISGVSSLVFHIDYDTLVNIGLYDIGTPGRIYFDYNFTIGIDAKYGQIWEGTIYTMPE